jgi:PIN domain nuclease of toxin-antitoxin system
MTELERNLQTYSPGTSCNAPHTRKLSTNATLILAAAVPLSRKNRVRRLAETYPKDPADRIIGATAIVAGMSLLTADREIRRSRALRTIW